MYKTYDPFEIVRIFERQMASYAGSAYGVAVDTCSAAITLCCEYLNVDTVILPKKTYVSVPQSVVRAGGNVVFRDIKWGGEYPLTPYPIIDGSLRMKRNMHKKGTFRCLSFHYKKHIDIGRGGMILFDDKDAIDFFIQKRFHGRHELSIFEDQPERMGYPYNMEPSRAADGLHRMLYLKDDNEDIQEEYSDLSMLDLYADFT